MLFSSEKKELLFRVGGKIFSPIFILNLSILLFFILSYLYASEFRRSLLWGISSLLLIGFCFASTRLLSLFYLLLFLFGGYGWTKNSFNELKKSCQNIEEIYGTYVRQTSERILLLNAEIYCENKKFKLGEIQISGLDREEKSRNRLKFIPTDTRILITQLKLLPDSASGTKKTKLYNKNSLRRLQNQSSNFVRISKRFEYFLSSETVGLYQAILLGDRKNLSKEQKNKFAKLGIFHLFAVSGLHTGVLFLCFSFFFALFFYIPILANHYGYGFRLNLSVSLLAVLGYLWWIGFPVTALRSWWLLFGYVVGQLIFYRIPGAIFLTILANGMLLVEPSLAGNLSFRLSFSAVATIFYLLSLMPKKSEWNFWKRMLHLFVQIAVFSAAIEASILPMVADINATVNPISPLNNIFHILFLTWIFMPAGILGILTSQVFLSYGITTFEYLIYMLLDQIGKFWLATIDRNFQSTKFFIFDLNFLQNLNVQIVYYILFFSCALFLKFYVEILREKKTKNKF